MESEFLKEREIPKRAIRSREVFEAELTELICIPLRDRFHSLSSVSDSYRIFMGGVFD